MVFFSGVVITGLDYMEVQLLPVLQPPHQHRQLHQQLRQPHQHRQPHQQQQVRQRQDKTWQTHIFQI